MSGMIIVALAMAAGVVLGWLVRGQKSAAAVESQLASKDSELAVLKERLGNETEKLTQKIADFERVQDELGKLRDDLATAREELATHLGKVVSEEEAKKALKAHFAEVAADVLKASNETFLGLAEGKLDTKKAEINGLIAPMTERMKSLDESVRSLSQSEASLLNETRQLASALKDTKKRGNWGELKLKQIAELSGMDERCDFNLQTATMSDEGARLYPDMTVHLPNHRVIVVDSKASMEAYKESANSTDPLLQQRKLVEHGRAVRARVDELAGKEYQRHITGAADFVVCFIPSEAWFSAAVAVDADLLEYAAKKSVILASPTTLLTILRAVALGWKEARIAAEAKQIFSIATELYERFRKSTEYVEGIGNGLKSAINQYNSYIGSVEARVFPQARKLQRMSGAANELGDFEPIELNPRSLVSSDWANHVEVLPSLLAEGSQEELE